MGCNNSKPYDQVTSPKGSAQNSMRANPLTEQEIQMRIDCPKQSQTLELGGVTYRYAWVSQRGYYPEAPDKDNQDCYSISPSFGPSTEQQAFFAVYDGHGKDGHHCARFARDHLGKNILDKFSRIPAGGVTPKAIRQALSVAHYATNEAMHNEKRFDDSLSGTTSISILFRGKAMYISNVGDSRAIIVSKTEDGKLVARPLSSDQTPYRKDERERVKKYGARILSMDQIEGLEPIHENWGDLNLGEDIDEGGDPPRIWSPNGDYPGTAFTRSLGDMLAEECGVVPEPEILEREVQPNDRFIVIASDGVFEFLTNQMVADMLARYSDPLDACKAVATASYNMWLQYEVRTDDISIIALYIDGISKVGFGTTSSFFDSKAGPVAQIEHMEARPVRRVMSREKRKHMIQLKDDDDEDTEPLSEADVKELLIPKNEAEEQTILSAMKTNFLFQHLNVQQRNSVISVMKPVDVKKGDWIIRQGDAGDKFYIVDTGRYEVRVKPPNAAPSEPESSSPGNRGALTDEEMERIAGNVVHVYESGVDQHPGFGELSLMYGKPRAASVIALTDGKLWSLDRRIFRKVVLRPKDFRREIIRTLKKVELLKCLNITQLQRLTDLLNEKTFKAGEMIIRQGEQGFTFYLIETGHCECSINSPDGGPPKVVMQLRDHNYFGERALLESKPRAANVTAVTDTKVLYIEKAAFEEVLGPLAQIIDEDRARREAIAASELSMPKTFADVQLQAVVSVDSLGPLLLGAFNSELCNLTCRTFLVTDVVKGSMTDSVARYLETAKLLQQSTQSHEKSALIPSFLCSFKQSNAIHLVFESPVIADLSAFIRTHSTEFMENDGYLTYCFACIVSALERLHDNHIIYRAVQPETIYLDASGHVVLMDYRFCKLGLYGSNKTFTICGASDYLAPEQISQIGHSYPVDLWGMGVLLYELSVGSHPFSSSTEVATYNKISSFGTKSFPTLKFPDSFSNDIKSLINQLLVPTPEARIGAGLNGFHSLKKHAFFRSFSQWETIHQTVHPAQSPVAAMARKELAELLQEKLDDSLVRQFDAPTDPQVVGDLAWLKNLEL